MNELLEKWKEYGDRKSSDFEWVAELNRKEILKAKKSKRDPMLLIPSSVPITFEGFMDWLLEQKEQKENKDENK